MQNYYFLYLLILAGASGYAQSNTLSFSYDAGNQIERKLICINCAAPAPRPGSENQIMSLTASEEYPQISYYPNPVQEQLTIKWDNNENLYVNSIETYSTTGQLLMSLTRLSQIDTTSVSFSSLASGIYNVLLIYNTGEIKALKVIKK